MPIRKGHGKGAGTPHVEVLKPGKLPPAVPGEPAPVVRRSNGTIADSATARELGKRGGLARLKKIRLLDGLGLSQFAKDSAFEPYWRAGNDLVIQFLENLAKQAGGALGPIPSSILSSAAYQHAGGKWMMDKGFELNDPALAKLGSSMLNDSRQNLIAAFELAVREAMARRPQDGSSPTPARSLETLLSE